MTGREILIAASVKCDGDWDSIVRMIRNKERIDDEEAAHLIKSVRSKVVTIVDKDYPEALKRVPKAPLVIYYYGDLSLMSDVNRIAGYIGSRDASPYGLEMANYFGKALVERDAIVVSGMARGIDSAVQEAVLLNRGKTIAVLGSGIDNPYPLESIKLYRRIKIEGLVISEYPGRSQPSTWHFPMRNRIIAALSKLLIVGEAAQRSGTLITVAQALGSGIDVGCVPTQACLQSAANSLIKEGAALIDDASDLDVYFGEPLQK